MRWTVKPDDGWRRWFAIWPKKIGDEMIWLRPYWFKFHGEYTVVCIDNPHQPDTKGARA